MCSYSSCSMEILRDKNVSLTLLYQYHGTLKTHRQPTNQLQLALGESTGIVCGESLQNSQDWKDADIRSVI